MDVKNCRDCGRLFNYITGPRICPSCRDKLEEKFQQVKEYIRDNPNIGMNDIARENEVPMQQIYQWVREERLIFSDDSMVTIDCENCGKSIRTGRFCDKCKDSMINNLNGAYKKPVMEPTKRKHDGDRMRFLDK